MRVTTLLFDLDDTLVMEVPAAHAAFLATGELARSRYGIDPEVLADAVRRQAKRLWYAAEMHPYAHSVAISSWEGLWCRFEGEHPDLVKLRHWAPSFRLETWRAAIGELGIDDEGMARMLAERFPAERRQRHILFDDTIGCLERVRPDYRLALLSNGASDLQREKIVGAGLEKWFSTIIISADLGVRKPEPEYFRIALDRLGIGPAEAAMIGNSLKNDIGGAQSAGIFAVWLNRDGGDPGELRPDATIGSLAELPALLERL
jgi:putative hydrolase of the HAD superfamily